MSIRENIVEFMETKEYKPMLKEELAIEFGIEKGDTKEFYKVLEGLEKEGVLIRNNKDKYIVDYNLGINIPTGKAKLSSYERNARMDEDLVRFAEFGEGWNFTPGIAVTRRIGGGQRSADVGNKLLSQRFL